MRGIGQHSLNSSVATRPERTATGTREHKMEALSLENPILLTLGNVFPSVIRGRKDVYGYCTDDAGLRVQILAANGAA